MNTMILCGIVCVVLIFIIGIFNSLVTKKNQIENASAGIDTQLKKRYDLIPNLVSCVKTYMAHEKQLLTDIAQLRSQAISPKTSFNDKLGIDTKISKMLSQFTVAVENYPDLKSNQNFLNLQLNLKNIEDQLSAARRFYNSAVTDYNNSIEMFPSNVIAGLFGFQNKNKWFKATETERKNINVGSEFS